MKVEIIESTPNPEWTVCSAARNDYEDRFISEVGLVESMKEIDRTPLDEIPDEAIARLPLDGTNKDILERQWTLIKHLLDHGHFGPFEHPSITFAVKGVSRSLMAQLTRHRHATFDIQSMRYVGFEDAVPEPGEAVVSIPELETAQPAGRNVDMDEEYAQMSDEELLEARRASYERAVEVAFEEYKKQLRMGTAPENARMLLPIGTKVNIVFTVNARMLMHIADMRAAADAQWEIRGLTDSEAARRQFGDEEWIPEKGVLQHARDWMPMTFTYYDQEMKNRKNRLAP